MVLSVVSGSRRPIRAVGDPFAKLREVGVCQTRTARRHGPVVAARERDASQEFAVRRSTGDDGGARVAAARGWCAVVESQAAFLFRRAVALEALAPQDGDGSPRVVRRLGRERC